LIELLITLVTGSILLVIAVPSFLSFQQDNRRVTQINELVSGLNLARSEAIKSHATVGFCPSSNGTSCSGAVYDHGWIVFLNTDADSPPAVDAGETVLRAHPGTPAGVTLRAAGIGAGLNYAATGRPSAAGDITYCDDRGASQARSVLVSRVGFVTAANVHTDGSALTCP
jgi:type IV fimbrial biogenesis protein FimT